MRWNVKQEPKENDTRIVKRFALFPIRACEEMAWLETVHIKQAYRIYCTYEYNGCVYPYGQWDNVKFIES